MDQSSSPKRSTLKFSYDGVLGPVVVSPKNQEKPLRFTFVDPKN